MPKSFSSKWLIAFLSIFILLSDQISKFIVVESVKLGEAIYIWPFFNIVRVENKGITFGLLSGTLQPIALAIISLIIIIFMCIWAKNNKRCRLIAYMIISGAIGNLADRITRKAVVDFLDFHLLTYHWPAFNIADSAIVIGVVVLFFISFRKEEVV